MKRITSLKSLFSRPAPAEYDRENLRPVIRESICTGEQAAGFQNIHTGKISEVMLIRTGADLTKFCKTYGISPNEITTVY